MERLSSDFHCETEYEKILDLVKSIQPAEYAKSRNYLSGCVTHLSPYISRGVISTKQVLQYVVSLKLPKNDCEQVVKELAWRDYFQRVAQVNKEQVFSDFKSPQFFTNRQMPQAIQSASSGIWAIDKCISELYQTGYMHNHARMYVASIVCNMAKSHWLMPARWMYYHLLDADFASNALSWQWVAGTFSSKKYLMNQENINKYCGTQQVNSFLDGSYERIAAMDVPKQLMELTTPDCITILPASRPIEIDSARPTLIYNFYNLDPIWKSTLNCNRVLIIEPSHFTQFPVSERSMSFLLNLGRNINDVQVFVGEFEELKELTKASELHYKEHPLFRHYQGICDEREWMFPTVVGYHPSFFAYWKRCESYFEDLMERSN